MYRLVGNALVTIDAGFLVLNGTFVLGAGARFLLIQVHRCHAVTIAAFPGISSLHCCPNFLGKFQALGLKFFLGVDGAGDFVKKFVAGLDLTNDLMYPVFRNMAIGTDCPYSRGIFVVDLLFVFLINGTFHFMTGDAEGLGIAQLHGPVETTPEENAAYGAGD